MLRNKFLLLAAAVIGAVDAGIALRFMEEHKEHVLRKAASEAKMEESRGQEEAVQDAASSEPGRAESGPKVRVQEVKLRKVTVEDGEAVKQRRTFGQMVEAYRDRHYIELELPGKQSD